MHHPHVSGSVFRETGLPRPISPTSQQESELASKSLRDLEVSEAHERNGEDHEDPIERLRMLCLSRGATGIMELAKLFRKIDDDGRKDMKREQFKAGIKEIGATVSDDELDEMFDKLATYYGKINVDTFLAEVRPPVSENRMKIIGDAFNKLDKKHEGEISFDDIKRVYDVRSHSLYITGEESKEQIMNKFMAHFEEYGTKYGKVTKEEFFDYYTGVSASIDNDCYFDLMMRQAYKL